MASPTTTAGGIPDWAIRELERPDTDDQVLALLAQLRPDTAELAGALAATVEQRVRYLGAFDRAGRLVGLAGWRILATTRCRVLYVDDLVTDSARRGEGVGAALFAALERAAAAQGCQALELDSGVSRSDAHRFYARAGLSISAFHFRKPIDSRGEER